MATEDQKPQAEIVQPEPLMASMAFRAGESDKSALRLIALWNEESESDVLRRFFDFVSFRAEAARIRALRDTQREGAVA